MTVKDQTFCIRQGQHHAIVDGKVVRATWNSQGAAQAGIAVEQRRNAKRLASTGPTTPKK